MSHRKSDLGIPLPHTWLNPSTLPRRPTSQFGIEATVVCNRRKGYGAQVELVLEKTVAAAFDHGS
jgi:hypothetical protein